MRARCGAAGEAHRQEVDEISQGRPHQPLASKAPAGGDHGEREGPFHAPERPQAAGDEAARRAGINLARIRTLAFTIAAFTAGTGGILYASRLRSMSTSFDGGTIVLYVVASAVIGGTSMFGGRGHPLHPVLGGIVIAGIVNGMALLGLPAAIQLMATAVVLIVSVLVDVLIRRRAETAR